MFLFLRGGGGFRSFMGGWPRIYQDTIGTNGGGGFLTGTLRWGGGSEILFTPPSAHFYMELDLYM